MTDDCEILLGGIRLAHRVSGDPGNRPLVLLHALGEGAADWDGVRDAFARHRRVYAPDLRGHGRSDRPGAYSFELMRDDVLALLATLGPEPVDLVGHSMGGVVAYLVAAAAPERVRRLVLEDVPAPLPRKPAELTRPDGPLSYDWAVAASGRPPGRPRQQRRDPQPDARCRGHHHRRSHRRGAQRQHHGPGSA